jgi:hypothetical protein
MWTHFVLNTIAIRLVKNWTSKQAVNRRWQVWKCPNSVTTQEKWRMHIQKSIWNGDNKKPFLDYTKVYRIQCKVNYPWSIQVFPLYRLLVYILVSKWMDRYLYLFCKYSSLAHWRGNPAYGHPGSSTMVHRIDAAPCAIHASLIIYMHVFSTVILFLLKLI